jgi:hypothetical protein
MPPIAGVDNLVPSRQRHCVGFKRRYLRPVHVTGTPASTSRAATVPDRALALLGLGLAGLAGLRRRTKRA